MGLPIPFGISMSAEGRIAEIPDGWTQGMRPIFRGFESTTTARTSIGIGLDRMVSIELAPQMDQLEPSAVDSELFDRVQQGDARAFASFLDRHAQLLFNLAFRILGNVHDAEDVVQEASVLVWERAPTYRPMFGKPVSWAVSLTRNKAIDRLRSRNRKAELHEAAASSLEVESSPEPESAIGAIACERSHVIRLALARLPTEQRQAIEMAFFGGLTQMEISEKLATPLGTIKARIRRGMVTLRENLKAQL